MKNIYFKNSKGWAGVTAVTCGREEEVGVASLDESDGCLHIAIDNDISMLTIHGDNGQRTGRVFPGALSIGVDYRYNDKLNRDLTYLWSKDISRTGRVENHLISDPENLWYREDKSKRISVFLPESYDGVTPHDLLYFFDAQNLFCLAGDYTENSDPYGSWQLDLVVSEIRRQFGKNIVVVGIDNADMYRSNELFMDPDKFGDLSPLATAIPEDNFSKGYLESLSAFMVQTLHSFIKENYCISEENIGLGGSSMGGIASFFCGLHEKGFYKYVISYSPAFGLYEMNAFDKWFGKLNFEGNRDILPKIHIYCGGGDQLEMSLLPASMDMKPLLVKHGYSEDKIYETYDMEKPHNEESWRLVLPESFSCLMNLFNL